ncbi:MAG: hypothetical protein ABI778_07810, partial [Ignavibacteriota bacterium]
MKRQLPVIVIILVSFFGQVHAQVVWEKLSLPEAGPIYSVSESPSGRLYLSMTNHLYYSTDQANSWTSLGPSLSYFGIDSQDVFIKFTKSSISHSTDEGKRWEVDSISLGLDLQEIKITRDSIYFFTFGPCVFTTGNYGKTMNQFWFYTGSDLRWDEV